MPFNYVKNVAVINRSLLSTPLIRWVTLVCLNLFLLACSSRLPDTHVSLDGQQHQAALATLTHWQIRGKIGFKGPDKKQSANLSWEQNDEQYQLSLNSILGTSILAMQGNETEATLTADDQTYSGHNASELIWQITGWTLPVAQLPVWIKGQHLKTDEVKLAEQGWITDLQPTCDSCNGWLIQYADYAVVAKQWLPHKIVLIHARNQLQITIKVNTWIIN